MEEEKADWLGSVGAEEGVTSVTSLGLGEGACLFVVS